MQRKKYKLKYFMEKFDKFQTDIDIKKVKKPLEEHLAQFNQDILSKENQDDFLEKVIPNNNKQTELPFDEKCFICNSKITNKKFICIICNGCILCSKCEKVHIHPVLKCKSSQLSTLKDIFIYLNKRNKVIQSLVKNEKDSSVFGIFQDVFSGKYEIKLSTPNIEFTMRPNKSLQLPIILQNMSNSKLNCELLQLTLYGKNTKDLKVYDKRLTQVVNKREQIDINILIESNNYCSEYIFTLEIYSTKNIKLKVNSLELKIIVNNDKEEEILNEEFSKYPSIIVSSKETKAGIKKILDNKEIKEDPITILQFLKNNNNNVEKTLEQLNELNELNGVSGLK